METTVTVLYQGIQMRPFPEPFVSAQLDGDGSEAEDSRSKREKKKEIGGNQPTTAKGTPENQSLLEDTSFGLQRHEKMVNRAKEPIVSRGCHARWPPFPSSVSPIARPLRP